MKTSPRGVLRFACALAVAFAARSAVGDIYDPPPTYYNPAFSGGVLLSGAALKNALNDIIDVHTTISYDNARYALQITDEDVAHPGNLFLFYDHEDLNVAAINPNGTNSGSNIKGWDAGVSWQREHTWPQSRGADAGPMHSDLFLLRPADSSNQSRSNLNYGGSGTVAGVTGGFYFPGNADKGDAARGAFYADVCYDGVEAGTVDLQLVDGNPASGQNQMGNKADLILYNYADPPDQAERRRNDLIYRPDNWSTSSRYTALGSRTFAQGNRNPFIDHPEWVWAVFGGGNNTSKLSLGTATSDGATTTNVSFGKVIVGATAPALTATVTLSKSGAAPTYYSVTPAGLGTSSVTGSYNAFITGTQSRSLVVGLSTNTSTIGIKTGTVTIDNIDPTTGGAGQGSADGNDIVNMTFSVVGHSNASFSNSSDVNTLNLYLGDIDVGSSATINSSIFNFGTAGLVADLDLDSFTETGDAAEFSTDLAAFTKLAAGNAANFDITFTPDYQGVFSATYTLFNSDENIAGATNGTSLVINVSGFGVILVPEPTGLISLLLAPVLLRRRR